MQRPDGQHLTSNSSDQKPYGDLAARGAGERRWGTVLDVDYAAAPIGKLTGTVWRTLTRDPKQPGRYRGFDRMHVVNDRDRGRVLRVDFTGRRANPTESIVLFVPLAGIESSKAVSLTDWMFYPKDYVHPPGAKTPGLGAQGRGVSVGQASGGGGQKPGMARAFSVRPMVYSAPGGNVSRGVPGSVRALEGRATRIALYSYHPGMGQPYGRDYWNSDPGAAGHWPGTTLDADERAHGDGRWHKRQLVLEPNTFHDGRPRADGTARLYIDDKLVVQETGIPWRTDPDVGVTHLWFHHFYGGHTRAWAAPHDQHYLYDGPVVEVAD